MMMMNSTFTSAKSAAKNNETLKQSQHFESCKSTATPVDVDSVGWKSDASVHQRLVQVSDKIQKWKTQLEIDSKVKDRKLGEALQTIEKLRTNVFELQAENETLGRKLHQEIGNRDDVIQRLSATREMCIGLKNFASHVETRLSQCEAEKLDLSTAMQAGIMQCRDLCDQFSQLTLKSSDSQAQLESKLALECSKRTEHEKKLDCQLSQIQSELIREKEKCSSKDESITALQKQNKEKEDEFSMLQKEYSDQKDNFLKLSDAFAENEKCITSLSKKCEENESLIESLMQEGVEVKSLAELLGKEIDDKKKIIESLENECSEKAKTISELQITVEDLRVRLELLQNKFDETVDQMKKELEQTKNAGNQELITLKEACDDEMAKAVDKLKSEVEEMSVALEKCKQQFADLFEEHRMLEVKLDCREDECSKSLRQFQELLEICSEIYDICIEQRDKLAVLLDCCINEIEEGDMKGWTQLFQLEGEEKMNLRQNLGQVQEQLKVSRDDDAACDAEDQIKTGRSAESKREVKELTDFYYQFGSLLFDALKKASMKLEHEMKEKADLRQEFNQELQNLHVEKQTLLDEKELDGKTLQQQKELNAQTEEKVEILKSEVEILISEKQRTDAQLKDSVKEISSLKTSLETLHDKLRGEKEMGRNLDCRVEKEKQERLDMEQSFKCQLSDANKEKDGLKKLCEHLRAEKDSAEAQMRLMASELSSSLMSYKQGCDDVVARKDKEFEEQKKAFVEEVSGLNSKLKELQMDLAVSRNERETLSLQLKSALETQAASMIKTLTATPVGREPEVKDTIRKKEKNYEGISGKPLKVATPLKPRFDASNETYAKPTPASASKRTPTVGSKSTLTATSKSTPTLTVTPMSGKKPTAQVKGTKTKIFDDEKENLSPVEESELFAPHNGILRRPSSIVRKRSVMFASSQQSDDSSASELVFIPPVKSPRYRMENTYEKRGSVKKDGHATYKKATVRDVKPQKKQTTKDKSLAWFDSDAVFGFGPED